MRNGTADASKTISHGKMLRYRYFIDITLNNHHLARSLKGVYQKLSEATVALLSWTWSFSFMYESSS